MHHEPPNEEILSNEGTGMGVPWDASAPKALEPIFSCNQEVPAQRIKERSLASDRISTETGDIRETAV